MVSAFDLVSPVYKVDVREIVNKRSDDDTDKDRIAGSTKEAKGTVEETVGKVFGDASLQADGKSDKVAGKAQNVLGGLKDPLKNLPPGGSGTHRLAIERSDN